ncbi:MAG: nitrogen regulation protein NR(II) [Pseudomonadota bacterium]
MKAASDAVDPVPRSPSGAPVTDVLDALTTGVLQLDSAGTVQHLNPAAEALLTISSRRAEGRALGALVQNWNELDELLNHVLDTRESCERREVTLATGSDPAARIIADLRLAPLQYADGSVGVIVELLDAAPRLRRYREQTLLQQHTASRTMTRQLAHEIKNPLGGLRGAAQLLERQLKGSAELTELTEYTDVIIREADRLTALVDNMLGPASPPSKELINIHEMLDHLRRLLEAETSGSVRFEDDYDPSLPSVSVDRDQIMQAMINLGRNAVQVLGGQGGTIRFRTRAATRVVIGGVQHTLVARIDFEDDGPGVPDELRDSLFYPLVTGRADGTGLGLAIAQELVNRHGGLIELDPSAELTRFSLYLPITPDGKDPL